MYKGSKTIDATFSWKQSSSRMPPLNIQLKLKVIGLHREGLRQCDILRVLQSENSFKIGRRHLAKFIQDYEATGELRKANLKQRRPTKQTEGMFQFIDLAMERNDETTATDVAKMIREEFGEEISETTIRRTRRKLGWLSTGTKCCQLVRKANREKRLKFCRELQAKKDEFSDLIFTDESSIALERHSKITFHRWWEPPHLKGKPKHPVKVHVWAAISRRGVSKMAIFSGIMDAPFFVEGVLRPHLHLIYQRRLPG